MDSQKHHRRSIRLNGYDYSQVGAYFVTICNQGRVNLYGSIQNGVIQLYDAGKMIEKWYWELGNKFPDIQCGEMVIMPNHIHFIIKNVGTNNVESHAGTNNVGADLRVCPYVVGEHIRKPGEHIRKPGEHIGSPLCCVVQWFKTMTTNEYIRGVKSLNWQRFNKRMWQRNYYEHIIRNKNEYNRIAQYIINNPQKWEQDKLNGGHGNIVMEAVSPYGEESWMI